MATSTEHQERYKVMMQILRTVSNSGIKGIPRTLIMDKLSLSDSQLKKYLSYLLENGLVEKFPQQIYRSSNRGNESIYKITKKGMRFMHISQIESIIGIKSSKTLFGTNTIQGHIIFHS
ncbi:MAG: winged helix-turn-helix domain-containing protein [Thermoproteota archaeon]|jgi:predicted transcriptional regulator|nr:winged helix-turn-helix domain-containing protein [Thermoproteota archaeon]